VGKKPIRRAFKKIRIQMIADTEYMGELVFEFPKRTLYECRPVSTGIADGRESATCLRNSRSQEAPIPVLFGNRAEKALRFSLEEAS